MKMIFKNDWESSYFSEPIYCLESEKWDQEKFLEFVSIAKPYLVECKIDAQEYVKINKLIAAGFNIVDVAADFSKDVELTYSPTTKKQIETASKEDIDELCDIAGEAFVFSRYNDKIFGPNASCRVYKEWVTKAVLGEFDDICLIKRDKEEIEGFITCRYESKKNCRIGLVAVKKRHREKGVGKVLLREAERYADNMGHSAVCVATQYSNTKALKYYTSDGYYLSKIFLWLYWS